MKRISRRIFLSSSAGAAAAVISGAASDRVRVGIIGLGRRGGLHAWGFSRAPNVDVCLLCDLKPARLDRFAAVVARTRNRMPATSTAYQEVLDRPDIDAVAIALPERLRSAAVHRALEAGKHVLLDPNGLIGLKESLLMEREAQSRGLLIDLSQDYVPVQRYMASAGLDAGEWQTVSGRLLIGGTAASLTEQAFGGLELARRILGCMFPTAIAAFELSGVSCAASFSFAEDGYPGRSLHWEVRRQPSASAIPDRHVVSVHADGDRDSRFAEWTLPRESDITFKPGREPFQAFAGAVRQRDARQLLMPLAEGRVTSALIRLAAIAGKAGRPLRFDPMEERLVGESSGLQEKLG